MRTLATYAPAELYAAGWRHSDGWTVDEAVEEYMRLHPEADEAEVRHEVEGVAR